MCVHIQSSLSLDDNTATRVQADYDSFIDTLPENSPRYGLFDYEFETEDHCHKSKMVFFSWIPDTARIKEKMMYASSKENLKRKLNGIQVEVQATDASEVEQSVMHEKCMALAG